MFISDMADDEENEQNQGHASSEEAMAALRQLSAADLQRLKGMAKSIAWALASDEADELLAEAIRRTLDLTRKWKKGVPLLTFLYNAMRSIAHERRKERRDLVSFGDLTNRETGEPPDFGDFGSWSPEEWVFAGEVVDRFARLFADDPEALHVALAKMDGKSPAETMLELKLSQMQYDTILRRVRRRIVASGLRGAMQ